jgi:hypothetical protein
MVVRKNVLEYVYNHMINRVGKMCVAAMSLCMILIVTRKRGDGRYYFAL